ncbi:MAG: phosphoribosylanthranilate isomerase [Verrucomicrobiota bacterium]|nr:phosphoribosylanthranilate isomerase [Verrucomicrobiota bacterium]
MPLEIKICGLTNAEDAAAAAALGADYLGFVLYPKSPRATNARALARILSEMPQTARAVGVFVNSPRDEIEAVAADCGLRAVQLHGDEQPEDFRDMPAPVWRAVHFQRGVWTPRPADWPGAARYVVDAAVARQYGGTGVAADWLAARELAAGAPVMLAGGLTAESVAEAIRAVRPLGVDVAGGVESRPGRKDHGKMRAFIARAREAARDFEP